MSIYPNPAKDVAVINLDNEENVRISIISVTGKEVYTSQSNGRNSMKVPLADLSKGVYSVKIISDKDQKVMKLIKQ
jgi:hypothetical protein